MVRGSLFVPPELAANHRRYEQAEAPTSIRFAI